MIRVLLVDDEALVRTGLRLILDAESDITVVGEAADGEEAVRQTSSLTPDVVIMDIRMPVLDGVEATARLTASDTAPAPKVVVLTTFDLDEHVYAALAAGASGFLLKDTPADQLVHAVRVVAAGDALLAPSVTRRLIAAFARPAPQVKSHRR
jgi:DNA-binding NarL/FixJ family response regulator